MHHLRVRCQDAQFENPEIALLDIGWGAVNVEEFLGVQSGASAT
jgi:hypothetical protein